ncbi:YeeE/YedE family protein [Marinoscillum sp.]|uniref:YeeE/YedE family protein n=1 Tax=Marinoscillum sp. TaxID=2024838 RepID=UPI003BAC3006
MDWLKAPWPWYIAGPMITLVMVTMFFFGKTFGISSTLKTVCSIGGAGKFSEFFRYDWKSTVWNLFFVAGCIIGGYIASVYMSPDQAIDLNPETIASLQEVGILNPGAEYLPTNIFNWENLLTVQGLVFMVLGGILVGFGTRYADGCTSGHAITGLSNLQWPSLVAVIGFFIGGLMVTHFILPVIL